MMEKQGGALQWSEEQNAEFELEKTALICLSRKRVPSEEDPRKTIPTPRIPITIRNHVIQPSKSHKFLSVIIDQDLNFKEQAAYTMSKGTAYVMACNRMIQPTKGIHGKLMKKLYEGVIVPKMLYAADVWCAGLVGKGRSKKGGRGARGFASQMSRVQRMAMLLIMGGLRSTATDILDAHSDILPFQQLLRKTCLRAMLCMATQPKSHPLAKKFKNTFEYGERRDFKGRKREKTLPITVTQTDL